MVGMLLSTPLIAGSANLPDITITVNIWVPVIIFAVAILWHVTTKRLRRE